MNERTLEQALARAEIARQPGACHFYSVATYHDALVDLVLLADEVKRLRATGVEAFIAAEEELRHSATVLDFSVRGLVVARKKASESSPPPDES